MALTTNIVAYYKMQGNSNDSVSTNNGTDSNMTYASTAPTVIGQYAVFNGTNGKITIPSGIYSLFSGTSQWTVNLWIKPASTAAQQSLLYTPASPATNFRFNAVAFYVVPSGGGLAAQSYRSNGTTVNEIDGATIMSAGTFYMLTLTYDGSNINLYINATSDATPLASTLTAVTAASGQLGEEIDGSVTGNWYNGGMDEIGFWSRALTSTEITQLYNGGAGLQYPFTVATNSGFFFAVGR